MNNLIGDVNWIERSRIIDALLDHNASLTMIPLESGLEAEVTRINSSESSVVLKVWNRSSKPNIELQYKLLDTLYSRGLSVAI
ncbi:hypothetical protein D3C77_648220 [compost metagenome]